MSAVLLCFVLLLDRNLAEGACGVLQGVLNMVMGDAVEIGAAIMESNEVVSLLSGVSI